MTTRDQTYSAAVDRFAALLNDHTARLELLELLGGGGGDGGGGEVTFGPSTAETTFGGAKNDGTATTVARSDHGHGNPTHANADHGSVNLSALAPPLGPLDLNGQLLTDVGTPVSPTDATTKAYVDGLNVTAGAGLTRTGASLDVGAGTGITVAPDSVAVDPAVVALKSDLSAYPRKYATAVGGATSVVVTHNLGTRDVAVNVYRVASPYETVECDVERTSTTTVTLRFATAPAAGEYRAVVIG